MRLLVLLLLPIFGFAQDAPKGAEGIILSTSLSDSLLFEKVISHLTAKDYSIDKDDIKRGLITTDNKASAGALSMRILVNIKEGSATFKGQWSAQAMGYTFTNEPVRNKGMAGSPEKKSFLALNTVVSDLKNSISDSSLSYISPTRK